MSLVAAGLATAAGCGAAGTAAGAALPPRARRVVAGLCTAGVGAAGGTAGVAALAPGGDGAAWAAELPGLLPLAGTALAVDALSGLFMAVAGAVVVAVAVYGIGYAAPHAAHRAGAPQGLASRTSQAVLPFFALTLVLVPAAASVPAFLALWELMALASLLLVLAEHRARAEVRRAGVWYAVMTQLGLVLLLAGFALFAGAAGGERFAVLRAGAAGLSPAVRGTVFVLTGLAFASKAGTVPLHAWLPRAHPEAPAPVSALMSAAMVNLGAYGIVRTGFDLLGGGPAWWWLALMALGGLTAAYGILQAAMASDLKRLLAHSTAENMGLVLVGTGAAGLFAAEGDGALAALALSAGLLHVVNHSAFKALLFGAAGSVVRATGVRDLDRLGGLRARMPVTAGLFAVGALGAVALPPGNGFVSEWLLLQSLIHGLELPGLAVAIALPLSVGLVALSAGIAAAVFVKALGVGFFARPRGHEAHRAGESPPLMLAGLGLLAAACAGLALAPGLLGPALERAVAAAGLPGTAARPGPVSGGGTGMRLHDIATSLSPLWVVAALTGAVALTGALSRVYGADARHRRAGARLWDCGGGPPTARMAYTATSFAEPLRRVFDDVLAPEQDVAVTHALASAYLVERVRFRHRVPDRIEHRLYEPVLGALARAGRGARRLASGSVHLYLGYGFLGLLSLFVVLVVGW
ncbi:proton-conducting transporter membrane subunit [Streptomyces sp. NPDC004327]|uniref:proton-conducting transporter transmembrane domain-containing protein n=1 Tax=unclassified Streptomyces TaxID=2593676 RepID=UPI0036A84FA8